MTSADEENKSKEGALGERGSAGGVTAVSSTAREERQGPKGDAEARGAII